jgi:hypothetical protein
MVMADPSDRVFLWPLACWDCWFESHRCSGYLSLVIVLRCQVEVSAMGWSLVQRSPNECVVSECDREALIMRRVWPTTGSWAIKHTIMIAFLLAHDLWKWTEIHVYFPSLYSLRTITSLGARGGVLVKALRYKPAGCVFDSRWCHWNFSVT